MKQDHLPHLAPSQASRPIQGTKRWEVVLPGAIVVVTARIGVLDANAVRDCLRKANHAIHRPQLFELHAPDPWTRRFLAHGYSWWQWLKRQFGRG